MAGSAEIVSALNAVVGVLEKIFVLGVFLTVVIILKNMKGGEVTMAINIKAVQLQANFCQDLMQRLTTEIKRDSVNGDYYGMCNYTQKKADIIRLRRELNALNALIDPYLE